MIHDSSISGPAEVSAEHAASAQPPQPMHVSRHGCGGSALQGHEIQPKQNEREIARPSTLALTPPTVHFCWREYTLSHLRTHNFGPLHDSSTCLCLNFQNFPGAVGRRHSTRDLTLSARTRLQATWNCTHRPAMQARGYAAASWPHNHSCTDDVHDLVLEAKVTGLSSTGTLLCIRPHELCCTWRDQTCKASPMRIPANGAGRAEKHTANRATSRHSKRTCMRTSRCPGHALQMAASAAGLESQSQTNSGLGAGLKTPPRWRYMNHSTRNNYPSLVDIRGGGG